ncbi:SRPBCC family protein [Paenibacillus sp. NPDC058174]|uniref:SRPBCC family protein n=1 Tax=Paenibacillus sp. NPDC058174 TaxID=3346366 RepID=UPI0036D9CEDA
MLANIQQVENGYTARFERKLNHSAEEVWAWLTENDKLAEWFAELRIDELRAGGAVKFDMGDGQFVEMEIFVCEPHSILEYAWDEDRVRFELHPESEGCRLVLEETIHKITEGHTAKDLAGWQICLDVIEALMNGESIEPQARRQEWEKIYPLYAEAVESLPR